MCLPSSHSVGSDTRKKKYLPELWLHRPCMPPVFICSILRCVRCGCMGFFGILPCDGENIWFIMAFCVFFVSVACVCGVSRRTGMCVTVWLVEGIWELRWQHVVRCGFHCFRWRAHTWWRMQQLPELASFYSSNFSNSRNLGWSGQKWFLSRYFGG